MSPVALDPAGPFAAQLTDLSWLLIVAMLAVLGVVALATAVALFAPSAMKRIVGRRSAVLVGGLAFPAVVLSALLFWSLAVTDKVAAAPAASDLRIRVTGEMWWWRVHYLDGERILFETANEIHIPTGRTVAFELASNDVIHAFWIPQLGGKMDMVPGRTNVLRLQADAAGVYRGQCTEYCGGAHALMAVEVIAQPQAEYEAWLAQQTQAAAAPSHPGWTLFAESGCGACHAIRGTTANGLIGPDLTHVGSRRTLAAVVQPNTREALARFIRHAGEIKPSIRMPDYDRLSSADVDAITAFLGELK